MRIMVTGGAGYVGSMLTRELKHQGHEVIAIDPRWFTTTPLIPGVEWFVGEIQDVFPDEIRRCDAVAHLGGFSNDPTAEFSPELNHHANVVSTEYLVKSLVSKTSPTRVVLASSCSVYHGAGEGPHDEDAKLRPAGHYSVSKLQAEQTLLTRAEKTAIQPVVLRKGTVYGYSPRMRFDLVINAWALQAWKDKKITVHDPSVWRPLLSISDAVAAYVHALTAPIDSFEGKKIFNVAEHSYQIGPLTDKMFDAAPDIDVWVEDDPSRVKRSYRVSTRRAKKVGFRFTPSVDAAIADVMERLYRCDFGLEPWNNAQYFNIARIKELFG